MNQTPNMPSASRGGRKLRNDLLLIAAVPVMAALAGLFLFLSREEGARAVVTVDGEPYAAYSLAEDVAIDIRTGADGEQINRLVIRDGKAFVETATCPDGICAAHNPIAHEGESIVCLPHRVVIAVEK